MSLVKTNDGRLRRILPTTMILNVGADWSPQGNEIIFLRYLTPDVHGTIWVVRSDGTGLREIKVQGLASSGVNDAAGSQRPAGPGCPPSLRAARDKRQQIDVHQVRALAPTQVSGLNGLVHRRGPQVRRGSESIQHVRQAVRDSVASAYDMTGVLAIQSSPLRSRTAGRRERERDRPRESPASQLPHRPA